MIYGSRVRINKFRLSIRIHAYKKTSQIFRLKTEYRKGFKNVYFHFLHLSFYSSFRFSPIKSESFSELMLS